MFSVHPTMIQPYFSLQFLSTMFSFVLVCVKRRSLRCVSSRFTQSANAAVFLGRNNVSVFHSVRFVEVLLFTLCQIFGWSNTQFFLPGKFSHAPHWIKWNNLHLFSGFGLWCWYFWQREFFTYCSFIFLHTDLYKNLSLKKYRYRYAQTLLTLRSEDFMRYSEWLF